jgi:ParB family chromosome partitioning protein
VSEHSKEPKWLKFLTGKWKERKMSDFDELENEIENEDDAPKEQGLGRGLAALFGDDDEDDIYSYLADDGDSDAVMEEDTAFRHMPVEWMRPCEFQPRQNFDMEALKELADSIAAHGIIQPILVRPMPEEENAYEIIAGERRWRAAQIAQLHQVPVTIQYLTDSDVMELALIENLQRENLTAIEEAEAYQRLIENYGHTQEKLAAGLGKSRSHIANMLRLLTLPETVKDEVNDGKLSAGHARSLVGVKNPEEMAQRIIDQGLSVREAERMRAEEKSTSKAATSKGKAPAAKEKQGKSVDILALESELSQLLGLNVSINAKGQGGELVIAYQDLEQMDEILHRLSHNPGKMMVTG